jgi:hypothetical protein
LAAKTSPRQIVLLKSANRPMRPILTAIAAALLWNAVASAGFEISDLLFRPNFNADRDLMQHAQAAQREPAYQLQEGNAMFSKDLQLLCLTCYRCVQTRQLEVDWICAILKISTSFSRKRLFGRMNIHDIRDLTTQHFSRQA